MGFLKIDVGASTKVCIEIRSTPGIAISSDHDRYRLCIQSITRYGKLCLQFYQLIRYFADRVGVGKTPESTGHDVLMETAMVGVTMKSLRGDRPVMMIEVLG